MTGWYAFLSGLTQSAVIWLDAWLEGLHVPLLMAALLGVIGATSPCQLTTNLGALAYASSKGATKSPLVLAALYVAGKVTVYTVAGALVVLGGLQLGRVSIPAVVVARKALGPLMVLVGLGLVRLVPLRPSVGQRFAFRLQHCLAGRSSLGAYLLGVAFAFAFCPTLFWLFFGLTVPLALKSPGGLAFPGVFALGSSVPLLAVSAAVAGGLGTVERLAGGIGRFDRPLRLAAGTVLVVAGLHDTVLYWMS